MLQRTNAHSSQVSNVYFIATFIMINLIGAACLLPIHYQKCKKSVTLTLSIIAKENVFEPQKICHRNACKGRILNLIEF